MGFSVLLCFLVTPCFSVLASNEVAYECGPHGKFEYCVDELADCVIGCHCHPGYYFDTDTKICEPNIKLTQNYRRQYLPEPTPTATVHPTYQTYPTYSTPTATEHLNNNGHEVTKDTDEIGNWLYNQFFKTIESQVISNSNNTKSNSDEKPPTRRSGGKPSIRKSKRKPRKSSKGRKKRKHAKDRMSRKLLRITEDDSLFDDSDSDSDSDSYSSSSDSDSRSDSSSSSDVSSDTNKRPDGKKPDTDSDSDHGHKKVIIFNRRPKPPLPSFIFLPSMDTPYYPPIGLPPPPFAPMYPMVPVPPVFPPFPGPPKCDDEGSKSTTTVIETKSTVVSTTTETTTQPVSTPEDINPTVAQSDIRRNRPDKQQKISNLAKILSRTGPGKQKKQRHKKLMQLYRQKLNKLKEMKKDEKSPEEILDEHLNSNDIPNISEDVTPHARLQQEEQEEIHIPKLEDVDFKYLSELIHRVNQSKSRNSPLLPFDLTADLKELQKLQSSLPTRRNIGSYKPPRNVHRQGPEDTYYSNLGRQIASMIRNADSEVEIQFSKDTKQDANSNNLFHSGLNENSFLPRSFWERSVRSPLLNKGPLSEYLDESRTLKHSNEKGLINLENEVEIYANTPHPMRLQDLENILNTIQKAHTRFKQPMTSTKQSNVSMNVNLLQHIIPARRHNILFDAPEKVKFITYRQPMISTIQSNVSTNVNLLPKLIRPARRHNRLFDAPEKVKYITEPPETPVPSVVYVELHPVVVTNASVFHEPETRYKVPYRDYWMFNREPVQQETRPRLVFDQTSKPIRHDNHIYITNRIRQPYVGVVLPKQTEMNESRGEYLHFLKSRPPATQATPIKHETKLNYFTGRQHYLFDTVSYPLQQQQILPSPLKTISNRMHNEPISTYFNNQLHQSEYFN